MAEEIAEKFENAMKIGFISALILIVLEKKPSYGYKICRQIEERTLGIWNPPSSTMYTALRDMTDKGLIDFSEKQVEGRNRKIYAVTPKGKETLKIMLEKHKVIDESIETLKTAMLGDEKGNLPKGFHKLSPFDLMFDRLDEKSQQVFTSVSAVFDAMPHAFVPDASRGLDVVFQYRISGKDGGDWFCVVKDNACTVEPGMSEKSTCTLKIADMDFLDMMNGTLIPMQAYTSGKLKIEGDIMKSQFIEKLFKLY